MKRDETRLEKGDKRDTDPAAICDREGASSAAPDLGANFAPKLITQGDDGRIDGRIAIGSLIAPLGLVGPDYKRLI